MWLMRNLKEHCTPTELTPCPPAVVYKHSIPTGLGLCTKLT
jgi:hypothetical protein